MPAAVEAGEAVAGFAPGIRHGGKGDGGVVEGARGLFVQEMDFGHHRDRCAVPRWGRLFFTGNLFLRMTLFAFGFVRLDTGEMGAVVSDIHRSAASGLRTDEMFVLQGLHKPAMCCPLLFCSHKTSLLSSLQAEGGLNCPFTARIERALSECARSASKKGRSGYPHIPHAPLI